jgi:serine phosphatase RsbU (regulator of sigma subunit)
MVFPRLYLNGCPRETNRDLEAAWQVQRHLFPRKLPAAHGWEFAALCRPARTVAGDYYDLFQMAPGRIAVALGDVSGKGLGPALVMAGLRALVRCRLRVRTPDLSGLMAELNQYLLTTTPDDMFVTLFLAILELATGRMVFVNAGHPPPVVVAEPTVESLRLQEGGTVLGILPDVPFEQGQTVLRPGSRLALFSDGFTETPGPGGELFHEKRIVAALRAAGEASAEMVLAGMFDRARRFRGPVDPVDDLSLIIIRRHVGVNRP